MYYSLVNMAKQVVLTFFSAIFFEYDRGKIKFTDGTRRISFSKTPIVKETYQWNQQEHPAVLVDSAVGQLENMSVNKDFIFDDSDNPLRAYFGGRASLTVTITCIAKTKEERDNLVDICALYLSRPDAKDYFMQNGMDIPNPVSISGETTLNTPNTDFELYQTDLTQGIIMQWEEHVDTTYSLLDIIPRIVWDDDPPEGKRVLGD